MNEQYTEEEPKRPVIQAKRLDLLVASEMEIKT